MSITSHTTSDKPDRILDAALELFAERGFHGTAVPLVAERAGVGAGTIYRYFDSKEALVNALYRRWKEGVLASLLEGFPFDRSPREQLNHFFRHIVRFAVANPAAFRFLEHHHHAPYLDEASRAVEARAMSMVRALLDETSRRGLTKDVPSSLLCAVVWGAIVRLIKDAEDGHLTLDPDTLGHAEQVLWEAVRA